MVYGNTVLLRKHDKYKIWLSVGGHVELDEGPNRLDLGDEEKEGGLISFLPVTPRILRNRKFQRIDGAEISDVYFVPAEAAPWSKYSASVKPANRSDCSADVPSSPAIISGLSAGAFRFRRTTRAGTVATRSPFKRISTCVVGPGPFHAAS